MADLRIEIDAIDRQLLNLLLTRSHYIDRAVTLKRIEGLPARTVDRVAKVLNNVTAQAGEIGLEEKLAQTLWSELIDWSIDWEARHLGQAPETGTLTAVRCPLVRASCQSEKPGTSKGRTGADALARNQDQVIPVDPAIMTGANIISGFRNGRPHRTTILVRLKGIDHATPGFAV